MMEHAARGRKPDIVGPHSTLLLHCLKLKFLAFAQNKITFPFEVPYSAKCHEINCTLLKLETLSRN
jgi:hypothetical protein